MSGLKNRVILLGGFARVGKDTAGAHLTEKYGVKRWAFADKLKAAAKLLTVWDKVEIDSNTEYVERPYWDGRDETKRHPCVQLGKVMRDVVDPVIWVRAVLEDDKFWSDVRETGVVLTDCRYLNEWRTVVDKAEQQSAQVEMIWLERDGAVPQGEEAATTVHLKQHAVTVTNNGTIQELGEKIDQALGRRQLRART